MLRDPQKLKMFLIRFPPSLERREWGYPYLDLLLVC
jgi:hypothetical protein